MVPEIPIKAFSVFAVGIDHAKCIAFDQYGELWAGGEAGQVYRISKQGESQVVANLGGFCTGLAFSPKDELFICNPAHGILYVDFNGDYSIFATQAGDHKIIWPNCGVFDSAGNYYVTDSGHWGKNNGYLLRFKPDGTGEKIGGPFGYASGLALSVDEKTLFMVESGTDSILRFEIFADGTVGSPTIYAQECGRFPDGLTLDVEGNLYVCCYASDEIWRISPAQEKTLLAWDRNAILLGSPTHMAFGGENFDELYVTNFARITITRASIGKKGQLLANQKNKTKLKPRPSAL